MAKTQKHMLQYNTCGDSALYHLNAPLFTCFYGKVTIVTQLNPVPDADWTLVRLLWLKACIGLLLITVRHAPTDTHLMTLSTEEFQLQKVHMSQQARIKLEFEPEGLCSIWGM